MFIEHLVITASMFWEAFVLSSLHGSKVCPMRDTLEATAASPRSLAACGGPNFDALKDDLKFGDEEISDVMTTYSMKIPQNKPGKLIRSPQYAWANKNQGNAVAAAGSAKVYFIANPSAQCDALNATNSQISDDDASEGSGTWTYVAATQSSDKPRKPSWAEKTKRTR